MPTNDTSGTPPSREERAERRGDRDTEPIEPGPDGMGRDDPSGNIDGTQMDGLDNDPTTGDTPNVANGEPDVSGLETGDGPLAEQAQELEQSVLSESSALDPSGVRVTRQGDELTTEITSTGRSQLRAAAESNFEEELGVDLSTSDVTLENADGGLRAMLTGDAQDRIQSQQRADARADALEQFQEQTGFSLREQDITQQGDGFALTEDAEQDIRQDRFQTQYSELEQQAVRDLREQTGAIIQRDDVDLSLEDGQIRTQLTDSGEAVVAADQIDEQLPGADIEAGDLLQAEGGEFSVRPSVLREEGVVPTERERARARVDAYQDAFDAVANQQTRLPDDIAQTLAGAADIDRTDFTGSVEAGTPTQQIVLPGTDTQPEDTPAPAPATPALDQAIQGFEEATNVDVPGDGPVVQPTGREQSDVDPEEQFGAFEATEGFENVIEATSDSLAQTGGDILGGAAASVGLGGAAGNVARGVGEAPGQLFGALTVPVEAAELAVEGTEETLEGDALEFADATVQGAVNRGGLTAETTLQEPGQTAGNVIGGFAIGAGASRVLGGSGSRLTLKGELDPRVTPFGDFRGAGSAVARRGSDRIRQQVRDFAASERGQLDLTLRPDGGRTTTRDFNPEQELQDAISESRTDFEPSRSEVLEGSPRDVMGSELRQEAIEQRQQFGGDFEGEPDAFNPGRQATMNPEGDVPRAEDVMPELTDPTRNVDMTRPGSTRYLDTPDTVDATGGVLTGGRVGAIGGGATGDALGLQERAQRPEARTDTEALSPTLGDTTPPLARSRTNTGLFSRTLTGQTSLGIGQVGTGLRNRVDVDTRTDTRTDYDTMSVVDSTLGIDTRTDTRTDTMTDTTMDFFDPTDPVTDLDTDPDPDRPGERDRDFGLDLLDADKKNDDGRGGFGLRQRQFEVDLPDYTDVLGL